MYSIVERELRFSPGSPASATSAAARQQQWRVQGHQIRAMTARIQLLLLAALLACARAQPIDEDLDGYDDADDRYDAAAEDVEGFLERSKHWQEMASRLQRSVDGEGLLRARRWGNAANGALLAATGPVVLAVSLLGLKLSNVVLSLYVTAFGGALTGIELGFAPIEPWVRRNLSFLTTTQGRTALLAFLGGLTWPLGKLGVVPALLTCVNALFNAHFQQLYNFVSEDDGASGAEPAVAEPPAMDEASGVVDDSELAAMMAAAAAMKDDAAAAEAAAEAEMVTQAAAEAEVAAAMEAAKAQARAAAQAETAQEAETTEAAAEAEAAGADLAAMQEALSAARAAARGQQDLD